MDKITSRFVKECIVSAIAIGIIVLLMTILEIHEEQIPSVLLNTARNCMIVISYAFALGRGLRLGIRITKDIQEL